MPDLEYEFPIAAPVERVFDALTTPQGLDAWWTLTSSGNPGAGNAYEFGFGPEYQWKGIVSRVDAPRLIEWKMVLADADWDETVVGAELTPGTDGGTNVRFWHRWWHDRNQHYRVSSYCWAMYLRVLRRYVERGEMVPYEKRLDV